MTVEFTNGAVEAVINERLRSGAFRSPEEVVAEALLPSCGPTGMEPAQDIEQLFAPLRGLNLDFSRNPSSGRDVDL